MSSTVNESKADLAPLRTVKRGGGRAGVPRSWPHVVGPPLILVAAGLATSGNEYYLHLATAAAIAYVLTASFNLIYGYGGIFNLSIIITYGLGAFTSVWLEVRFDMSFWLATVLALLVTAALSVLIALPSSTLNELFLAIQTLAFALALAEVLSNWDEFTGGTVGIYLIPSPSFFGTDLIGGLPAFYWLTAVAVGLVAELMRRIHRSGVGRRLVALREGPRVLASVGVSPASTRLLAFGLSGAMAGLAGVLFAHFQLVIELETFNFNRLAALLLATILGGAGYLYGPLFGVLALMVMDELSLATSQAQDLIYGVGVLVLVLATRGGIAGAIERLVRRLTGRRRRPEPELTADGHPATPIRAAARDAAPPGGPPRELEVRDLRVAFGGTVAVDDVSIAVRTGDVVGLIGPNGAGKTTLLNAITGDVRVAGGSLTLDGGSLLGMRQQDVVRRGVGRTFQSPKVIPELTLLENLMIAGDARGGAGWVRQVANSPRSRRIERETRERALGLLADFSLSSRAHHRAADQPYGVLRLVEVARNLMLDPAFILLDEPGAGLTEFEREEIAATIRSLSERQIGVVLVDHNMLLITSACDRVYVLDAGRVIAEGPPAEVFARSAVRAAYLGAVE
ncbi:branched-chain amino acid ABC transporter ATP-binding protein/permease [Phytohabitans sp. ZYX-F-186]|uniref:Branched-chain amino acid ABC transporter ATP-binding protein/permease n=1 Tax=Phytohabitans maris TaxID=3071409 RepID=A0ABU0ZKA5_9ACTN|nr:branched-chain amino acid ABC transporter ATP-binding protein/permease [Phytohabitans sp. ZYX-F-186]MDQ7907486.1 branched-chain amino acid ABC transporter ATP-binding protein/permease [Phytohabitans sp. ZYX-F-186]